MTYLRFMGMIGVSTLVMFIMMYLNTYALSHLFFSETRTYMALYMGSAMAVIMLLFMLGMYRDKKRNTGIFIGAVAVFLLCLYLVRSQITVSDSAYMKAMIPHHSIAILTSERANIQDARVRELADNIIQAQRDEIKQMQWLIKDIEQNGKALSQADAQQRPVPKFNNTSPQGGQDE